MVELGKNAIARSEATGNGRLDPHPTAGKGEKLVSAPEPKIPASTTRGGGYESGDYRYNTMHGYGR